MNSRDTSASGLRQYLCCTEFFKGMLQPREMLAAFDRCVGASLNPGSAERLTPKTI